MDLFRNSKKLQFGTSKLRQKPKAVCFKRKECFMEKKEEKVRGVIWNLSPLEKSKRSEK